MKTADETAFKELLELESFRRDRFVALGCDEKQARRAASGKLDWHDLESLLQRGCPLETALRILAPLP